MSDDDTPVIRPRPRHLRLVKEPKPWRLAWAVEVAFAVLVFAGIVALLWREGL